MKSCLLHFTLLLTLVLLPTGCRPPSTLGSLVLTQSPVASPASPLPVSQLDRAYPAGTRIVRIPPRQGPAQAQELSSGLLAAGHPCLSPDGQELLFSGKAGPSTDWQIYQVPLRGGTPRQLTDHPGGAMHPAWLPDGRFVYCAPVPKISSTPSPQPPSIYAQPLQGGKPEQLSYGGRSASDVTVMRDGRILFVGETPGGSQGLFTINSDGTEISPFGAVHDGPSHLRRPRELPDGRVVFLARSTQMTNAPERLEQIDLARPFSSRRPVDSSLSSPVRSAEPGIDASTLVALGPPHQNAARSTFAIYALTQPGTAPQLRFDDPDWHDLEAVECSRRVKPMGRLSTIDRETQYGRILCLNANDSADAPTQSAAAMAARVRFVSWNEDGSEEVLGESPVQSDGSFLVEVPANRPLGLSTLDAQGQVIRQLTPAFWVRPGENRACIGCHEPHNRAPRNSRPLATKSAPTRIGPPTEIASLTQVP